jgi:hypothetical protein
MLFASEPFDWIRDGNKAPAERAGKCSHSADENRVVDKVGVFHAVSLFFQIMIAPFSP